MKNKISIYIVLIIIALGAINFIGKAENTSHESERIHIHIQKNIFLAGEAVLFKLYCFNSVTQKLSKLSKVAYLELIDENGYAVAQKEVILTQGMGHGGFVITDQLSTGNYAINAYTHWMNTTSKELTSVTPIFVFNNYKLSKNDTDSMILAKPSSQFYNLKDNKKHILKPLNIDKKKNPINITSSVEDLDRYMQFTISDSTNPIHPNESLNFQITSNQGYIVDQPFKFTNNKWEFRIPKKELKSSNHGIWVKNSNKEILAQAVIHLPSNDKGLFFENPPIKTSPGERVTRKLSIKDFTNNSEVVSLSASIKLKEPFDQNPNIIEYFNIYSDFGASMSKYYEQLHGVSKQDWIVKNSLQTIWMSVKPKYSITSDQYPEQESYVLEGQIRNTNTKKAITDKNIYLSKIGEYADINTFRTKDDGKFFFQLPLQKGLHDISIQLDDKDPVDCLIELKEKFNQHGFAPTHWKKTDLTTEQLSFLKNIYENSRIRNIYNQETIHETNDTILYRSKSNFFGKPYSSLKIDDFIRLDSLEEYFHEFISPVKISYRKKKTYFNVYNPESLSVMSQAPLLIYDGLVISDSRIILNKKPNEIDRIEVVPYEYYYGKSHFYGIIHVISKDKDCKIEKLPSNTERYYLPLFTSNYSLIKEPASSDKFIPDFRTDLLWEPNITLRKHQDFELEFVASDVKGEYELIVEGISENGDPIVLKQGIFIE